MTTSNQRFEVGTQYVRSHGKRRDVCTIADFLTTKNLAGEVVQTRYVTTHQFCGQTIIDTDVPETEIARGCADLSYRELSGS